MIAGYKISVAILLFLGCRDSQEHTSHTEGIILSAFFVLNIIVIVLMAANGDVEGTFHPVDHFCPVRTHLFPPSITHPSPGIPS
jgi:hypothetical protein